MHYWSSSEDHKLHPHHTTDFSSAQTEAFCFLEASITIYWEALCSNYHILVPVSLTCPRRPKAFLFTTRILSSLQRKRHGTLTKKDHHARRTNGSRRDQEFHLMFGQTSVFVVIISNDRWHYWPHHLDYFHPRQQEQCRSNVRATSTWDYRTGRLGDSVSGAQVQWKEGFNGHNLLWKKIQYHTPSSDPRHW